jgi:PAS domain S-box-containing protein
MEMKIETIKVLLIEDDEDDYILTRELLSEVKGGNYALDWASSYEEGLKVAGLLEHQVCLVDYRLGERSGVQLIREAREIGLNTPMILLTGQGNHDVDMEAIEAGATDYLVKDETSPSRLERTIRYAVQLNTERKQAELVRLQAAALESADNAILITNHEGTITWVNSAFTALTGYAPGEVLGQNSRILESDQHDAAFYESMWQTLGSGRVWHGEMINLRKDGSTYFEEQTITPVLNETGEITNFIAVKQDISERRRAEEGLRTSEIRYRRLFESAKDGILILDADSGQIVDANPYLIEMLGFSKEELAGKELWEIGAFKDVVASKLAFAELRQRGYIRYENLPLESRDGLIRQVEFVSNSYLAGDSRVIQCNIRDITERKQAEEKLTRLATAVEQSGDGIIITDPEGNIQYVNPAFEQTTGYSSTEVIGKNPRFLKGGKASVEYYQNLWKTITNGVQWTGHFTNKKKDGTFFKEEATISPVRDAAGQVISYVAVKRDITERMRAEEEIRQLNQELEQRVADRTAQFQAANKELEAFSYSVSHDLRAPLRHINGFSQALLEDYADKLDETGKNYLNEVRSASQEMAQLIDDVLELARVTRSEMRKEEVSLSELARSVVADLQKTNGRQAVTVNIEEDLCTRGDKRLLQIVLNNLMGNAWKFTSKQDKAEITFGSQQQNGEASYFVRDNGAGFDMTYVGKLFGAFQRLHTAGEFEGTGIGLATVQRIINRHGGRVWAEGTVNEGATFHFTLPHFKEIKHGDQSDPVGGR